MSPSGVKQLAPLLRFLDIFQWPIFLVVFYYYIFFTYVLFVYVYIYVYIYIYIQIGGGVHRFR